MINGFEHSRILIKDLPAAWQEEGVLDEFRQFLQRNWQQRSIFYSDGYYTGNQQFIDFDRKDAIKLQNYIGTIVFKGEQLNIFPKVFKSDEDDWDTSQLFPEDLIKNLLLWLEYCDRLNFPFIQFKSDMSESTSLIELFITVYVHYVKSAIERQRFYRYEDMTETGTFVKGKIDFTDYVTKRYPSGNHGRISYTYSNFVFDNALNQIIKCTCKQLLHVTEHQANKRMIQKILMMLAEVTDRNCQPFACDLIKLSSLHANYQIILSMSKMFLMNKVGNAEMRKDDNFCFLFPAEVLFEGFIGGFLKEMLTDTAKVKTQASSQYLTELVVDGEVIGNVFLLKEDILVELSDRIVVLDTKYKKIDRFHKIRENKKLHISDSDMKQMAIYAAKRGAKKLFLLYPLYIGEEPETIEVIYNIYLGESKNKMTVPLEILKVPFAYRDSEEETKALLKRILAKVCR